MILRMILLSQKQLFKLVQQSLVHQQHSLLQADNNSHIFHGGFLKQAVGLFNPIYVHIHFHGCLSVTFLQGFDLAIHLIATGESHVQFSC